MSGRVLLWGDADAGKTALLASALYARGDGRVARLLDRAASAEALAATVLPAWRRLARGLSVLPTGQDAVEVRLSLSGGPALAVVDVRGTLARRLEDPPAIARLRDADAVVFVVAWDGRDLTDRMLAVAAGADLAGARPCGLAITKCERLLDETDARWFAGPGWWRAVPELARHEDALARFGDAVWPTSAYGYHREQGVPAVLLGEFGQAIPFGLRPVGVGEPFDWALQAARGAA